MKRFIIILTALLLMSFQFKTSTCEKFHDGKFKIVDKDSGTTYITRKNSIQTEINKEMGYSIKLTITWVNDCTYTLQLLEVIENRDKVPLDPELIMKVEITEVRENSYHQRTTSNKDKHVYESEVIKTE